MTTLVRSVITASPAPAAAVPQGDAAEVSFVMVTFGTGPIVLDALASLVASLDGGSTPYEVVVVDNPHPDRAVDSIGSTRSDLLLSTAGVTLVLPSRNLGFGGGCELGALYGSAPVVGFVNPDTEFAPGWLEPLLDTLRAGHGDGDPLIVAPTLLDPDGSIQEIGQTLFADGHTAPNLEPGDSETLAVADYASAACWLMRRDDHERIGGFDPAYHPAYFEDVDLAWRIARRGGATVVHRGATVTHHRGSGTPDAPSPAMRQRETLLATWPDIAWRQPSRGGPERIPSTRR